MSLASWEAISSDGNGVWNFGAQVLSGISGDSTFIFLSNPFGSQGFEYIPLSGQPQGVSSGRMRGIFRPDRFVVGSTNGDFGFAVQQSSRVVVSFTERCYCFRLDPSRQVIAIDKVSVGFRTGLGCTLASATFSFTSGLNYYMQGRWVTDLVSLGGVYLDMIIGTGISFAATFSASISVIDVVNPYASTVTEGVYARNTATTTTQWGFTFDDTQLFTSTP